MKRAWSSLRARVIRCFAGYAALGISRDIAVVVPTFTAAAAVVAATDLVASLPASLLDVLGPRLGLRRVTTRPLPALAAPIKLSWHERTDHDPILRAFRDLLVEVTARRPSLDE